MSVKYYFVGGYVRDSFLGVKSKDVDFAVEANSYEEMRDDILEKGMIIFQERPEYLTIRGRHPLYGGVDFTLCRKEGFYSDSRHPDDVEIGTIYDDLARRDFTVNAIAKTEDGEYIDPHHGRHDLETRTLHTVGRAYDRFLEDSLRLVRAIRFHIVRNFALGDEVSLALRDPLLINGLKKIPLERIYEELRKCFDYDTYKTLLFFHSHTLLEWTIFYDMGLNLSPRIGEQDG